MTSAYIQFHEPLHELLRTGKKQKVVNIQFKGRQTIKHLVESLGVPHTEVGRLQIKKNCIGFGYLVKNKDTIQVYPATPAQDNYSGMFAKGKMTIPARFILDNHLGKLATDLRMMGFDADYSNQYQDQELAELAVAQERIILTRDRQLLMRKTVRYGYLLRSLDPDQQLLSVLERFNLYAQIMLFERCMRCNHNLEQVEKVEIEHRLEPLTKKYFFKFKICPNCKRVYWSGSHTERIKNRLSLILPREISRNILVKV